MAGFDKIVKHVAEAGEHVLEWLEGTDYITINGRQLWAEDVLQLIDELTSALTLLGSKVPERPR